MDGNRRYAKARGLSPIEGHRAGAKKLEEFVLWAKEAGVTHVIAYAFSTENWRRPKDEVDGIFSIFEHAVRQILKQNSITGAVRFIGDRVRLPLDVQHAMKELEERESDENFTLTVALSYGAREEILRAVKALAGMPAEYITEESFEKELATRGIPDPDMIIRTSGEQRLSNFLLWQSAYSELFFTKTLWPDFTKEEFLSMLHDYETRHRRLGA